jgi:hypothetical protein
VFTLLLPIVAIAAIGAGRRVRDGFENSTSNGPDVTGRLQEEINRLERQSMAETGHSIRPDESAASLLHTYPKRVLKNPTSAGEHS